MECSRSTHCPSGRASQSADAAPGAGRCFPPCRFRLDSRRVHPRQLAVSDPLWPCTVARLTCTTIAATAAVLQHTESRLYGSCMRSLQAAEPPEVAGHCITAKWQPHSAAPGGTGQSGDEINCNMASGLQQQVWTAPECLFDGEHALWLDMLPAAAASRCFWDGPWDDLCVTIVWA